MGASKNRLFTDVRNLTYAGNLKESLNTGETILAGYRRLDVRQPLSCEFDVRGIEFNADVLAPERFRDCRCRAAP
jgi:hypothetical protein